MRTTVELPDGLVREAIQVTKAKTKTMVIVLGLQELIHRHKLEQLRAMRGTMPSFHIDLRKSRQR